MDGYQMASILTLKLNYKIFANSPAVETTINPKECMYITDYRITIICKQLNTNDLFK